MPGSIPDRSDFLCSFLRRCSDCMDVIAKLQNDLGPVFKLGLVTMTLRAKHSLSDLIVLEALLLHTRGEWGRVAPDDHDTLFPDYDFGVRMQGAYRDRQGRVFWIITEADRSRTTVMMQSDYMDHYAND